MGGLCCSNNSDVEEITTALVHSLSNYECAMIKSLLHFVIALPGFGNLLFEKAIAVEGVQRVLHERNDMQGLERLRNQDTRFCNDACNALLFRQSPFQAFDRLLAADCSYSNWPHKFEFENLAFEQRSKIYSWAIRAMCACKSVSSVDNVTQQWVALDQKMLPDHNQARGYPLQRAAFFGHWASVYAMLSLDEWYRVKILENDSDLVACSPLHEFVSDMAHRALPWDKSWKWMGEQLIMRTPTRYRNRPYPFVNRHASISMGVMPLVEFLLVAATIKEAQAPGCLVELLSMLCHPNTVQYDGSGLNLYYRGLGKRMQEIKVLHIRKPVEDAKRRVLEYQTTTYNLLLLLSQLPCGVVAIVCGFALCAMN